MAITEPAMRKSFIGSKETESFGVTLRAETTYVIYVHPDEPSVDFDLFVYDENANEVAHDTDVSSDAGCVVTPRWTGAFRIVVKSYRGASRYQLLVVPR